MPTPFPAIPAEPPPAALAAAEIARAIDGILATLLDMLWSRALYRHLLGPLALPVWTRLSRTRQRLARALAHLAAGRTPRPHPNLRGSSPGSADPHRPGQQPPVPNRRHGWLALMLDHEARNIASQLGHLLRQPGVAATLARSPGAARTLRPLCRMLGTELPPPLPLPQRPPRPRQPRPEPAAPSQPPAPPDRPIPRYVLAAARQWRRRERIQAVETSARLPGSRPPRPLSRGAGEGRGGGGQPA